MTHTTTENHHHAAHGNGAAPAGWHDGSHEALEHEWTDRARVVLTPVAAPSILGLFGFTGATIMVAAWMAGWYGDIATPYTLWPFALTFGGIAQFLAAMWSYRARDAVGTAMHGLWGSFWIAFGLLAVSVQLGLHPPLQLAEDHAFAWWFIVLSAITLAGTLAAVGDSIALFATLGTLTAGSIFAALGFYGVGTSWTLQTAGWVLVFSAGAAFYVATAMMMASSYGRTILPLGSLKKDANIPGRKPVRPIEYPFGMPGSKVGQS